MFTALSAMVVAVAGILPSVSLWATYSQELTDAYNWAYSKGVTTQSPIDNANMYGAITRAEMAKMLSVYAMEVLGLTPDTSRACTFTDIASVKGDLHDYIITSCQLGIMGQGITEFRPYAQIPRSEFGTALSRTLWGSTYDGGTPFYAKHLDALKAAGIMTQISNAESMKEVRGYVMLMLMRSEGNDAVVDCEDPMTVIACTTDAASCPAACREDAGDSDDVVVKSWSLVVSSSAAEDRSVIVASDGNAVSDLDTLTFRTSKEVTLNKVVLEKYGYANAEKLVKSVWLEDEDGNVISNTSKPNAKGLVNLTIKKDYKTVDGTLNATIVVETYQFGDSMQSILATFWGTTLGFKVTDVTSTAADVDLGNYKAYTYNVVLYDGTEAKVTARWGSKEYNWEASESYEVSKFKFKAPDDSAILVKGFTLTNEESEDADEDDVLMDVYDFLDAGEVEVTVAGKSVKATTSLNKEEELAISFKNPVEIAAKANVEFVVTAKLNSDFDEYGEYIHFVIAKSSDISATDKNWARITVAWYNSANYLRYYFLGGKVKLTNNKLGNIDASINSTDIQIADGSITVAEAVEGDVYLTVSSNTAFAACSDTTYTTQQTCETAEETWTAHLYPVEAIESIRLVIAGDEYDWEYDANAEEFVFENVEISESGKVKVYVDILDDARYQWKYVTFSSLDWDLEYSEAAKSNADDVDIAGSISVSKLTFTEAKWTLTNTLSSSDDIEFLNKETNRYTVLEGTYTAKKQDIYLNEFSVTYSSSLSNLNDKTSVRFYLTIDGDEVADAKATLGATSKASETFSETLVKAGKTVSVKLEAEIDAREETVPSDGTTIGKWTLELAWVDENDNNAWSAKKKTANMVIVNKWSVAVESTSTTSNLVLKKAADAKIAEFTVVPDGASSATLEDVSFTLTFKDYTAWTYDAEDSEVKLLVDGSDEDLECTANGDVWTCSVDGLNTTVDKNGIVVKVELEDEWAWVVTLDNLELNTLPINKTYTKRFEEAIVWFRSQSHNTSKTTFKFGVDKKSTSSIENVEIYYNGTWNSVNGWRAISDGNSFSFSNTADHTYDVTAIRYTVNWTPAACSDTTYTTQQTCETAEETWTAPADDAYITIQRAEYYDFFRVGMNEEAEEVYVGE